MIGYINLRRSRIEFHNRSNRKDSTAFAHSDPSVQAVYEVATWVVSALKPYDRPYRAIDGPVAVRRNADGVAARRGVYWTVYSTGNAYVIMDVKL